MDDCAFAQYPPITEAIRSRVESGWDPWPEAREWLLGKCDTIDAIHARLEAAYDHLRAERDSMAAALDRAEGEHDYAPESHYVMLPKDADGEPIHVGDKLVDKDDKLLKPAIVKCILYNDEGCVVSDIDPHGCWYDPSLLRHHKQATVEDLLRDMHAKLGEVTALYVGEAIDSDERDSDEARIFAEYAAKLRLAGDAE